MSFRVIGIGEVLWDVLPSGPQLGGAPGNFACHARQLGAVGQVVSRVGNDPYGRQALSRFAAMGLDVSLMQVDEELPTGTAIVALDATGTPHFTITPGVAWDAVTLTEAALTAAREVSAICFGTLAQRTPAAATAIQQLVAATPVSALRIFDINLRQGFYSRELLEQGLNLVNVLKLNDAELAVLTPMFGLTGSVNERIVQLARQFELRCVALTRAENGSLLYQAGRWSELPGRKFVVADTVGAGDAFTAGLAMGLLHQLPLDDVHRNAADIANFVCSCPGATPTLPPQLCAAFLENCKAA